MKHDWTPLHPPSSELSALEAWPGCGLMAKDGISRYGGNSCSLYLWSMEKGLEANSLESRCSLLRCGPSSISIAWELVRNAMSQLNWNLHFTRVPTGFMRTINLGEIWFPRMT